MRWIILKLWTAAEWYELTLPISSLRVRLFRPYVLYPLRRLLLATLPRS
jgi:hypothetical protein